jgi:fumarylacetoacetate (FAA) hydrolase
VDGVAYPEAHSAQAEPQMFQCASDELSGSCDAIVCASEDVGVDFEAGLAVVTGDVPMGCPADRALDGIRLLVLVNGVQLRNLAAAELARGSGLVLSKPAAAFSPVAITPDELGEAWVKGRVQLPLQITWNGRKVGLCDAGTDMVFHFGQLVAHLCKTRSVRAGTIVGSGPVRNKVVEKKNRTDWPKGFNCIADKRAMEVIQDGQASTEFMKYGDTIRIEMKGADGQSLFGAIEQELVPKNEA